VGMFIIEGASPRLEANEISANAEVGLAVSGRGTDPQIVGNRIHDGRSAGVLIAAGASPRFEDNEVWAHHKFGVTISGIGTQPIVHANRVHDGRSAGLIVGNGGSGGGITISDGAAWHNHAAEGAQSTATARRGFGASTWSQSS
jgi:Right handed beta helix region